MILYDRRQKVPEFLSRLHTRSQFVAADHQNHDNDDAMTTSNLQDKKPSAVSPKSQQFVEINRKQQQVESQRRSREDNEQLASRREQQQQQQQQQAYSRSSSNKKHPKSSTAASTSKTTLFDNDKFAHRLCCRYIMDDFSIAPNYALRMERLKSETQRVALCQSKSALSSEAADREGGSTIIEDDEILFSRSFTKTLQDASGKPTAKQLQDSLNLREIQKRKRQQQYIIVPKARPHSASTHSSRNNSNYEANDSNINNESLFNEYYHSASRQHQQQGARRPASAVPKLSRVYLVAAKSLEQEKIDAQLNRFEAEELEKERLRNEALCASRHEDLSYSRHLGFSTELSTLQVGAAEKNYTLTVQSHVNKMPLRYGRQYKKGAVPVINRSGSPTLSSSSRATSPTSGPNSRSVSPHQQQHHQRRPISAFSDGTASDGTFLTTTKTKTSNTKRTEMDDFVIQDDDFDQDGDDDEQDLVERKLLACMESKKLNISRPSSSSTMIDKKEVVNSRTKTPVFRMEKERTMYRDDYNNDETTTASRPQSARVYSASIPILRPTSGRLIPAVSSLSRPTSARTITNYDESSTTLKKPHPPQASSSRGSSTKNKWLPDGALSTSMIYKSKYNQRQKNRSPPPPTTASRGSSSTTPRKSIVQQQDNTTNDKENLTQQQTLQDVVRTPRGKNKNASYDPMNSARRTNVDRSADVGGLVGIKLERKP